MDQIGTKYLKFYKKLQFKFSLTSIVDKGGSYPPFLDQAPFSKIRPFLEI